MINRGIITPSTQHKDLDATAWKDSIYEPTSPPHAEAGVETFDRSVNSSLSIHRLKFYLFKFLSLPSSFVFSCLIFMSFLQKILKGHSRRRIASPPFCAARPCMCVGCISSELYKFKRPTFGRCWRSTREWIPRNSAEKWKSKMFSNLISSFLQSLMMMHRE